MKLLREYIRELLTEAAKGPGDLPDNIVVGIIDQGRELGYGSRQTFTYMFEKQDPSGTAKYERAQFGDDVRGYVRIDKPEHSCGGAWEVVGASARSGWGPMLYDVAMEWATQNGGGLISDRTSVSPEARVVWDYYLSNRADVKSVQLDDLENTITPEEEDNCDQVIASYDNRGMYPENVDWQESALSKRYTKPPTTMNALKAAGKLVIL